MKTPDLRFVYVAFLSIALSIFSPALSADVIVSPSGDLTGVTDQVNISDALEAEKSGGADGTVVLEAGTFYLNKSIVVFDFDGTFKGAGTALTTLQTAPGVDFDVSTSLDAIEGFSPGEGYIASMLLFPFTPSDEPRKFNMSDMRIVVDQAAVDPPLAGYVDSRLPYLLNTMHAVIVVNTDVINLLIGAPYEIINLDAVLMNIAVEGIQDPKFRGFWDGRFFDTNNSLFDGIGVFGANVGTAETIDVHVVNADIAFAHSDNGESLIENCVVENAILGIENWYNPTTALNNLILDARNTPILLRYAHNSMIEANSISGDGWSPMDVAASTNVDINNNSITGSWVYGINPWYGSNDCMISDNLLFGMSSSYGAISVESDKCKISNNTFVNVEDRYSYGTVWIDGKNNNVENNDYTQSGITGWPSGSGSILLDANSVGNKVTESLFPIVDGVQTTMCDQVLDLSGSGNNSQGRNAIPGYGVCNNNPAIAEHLLEVTEQRQFHTLELSSRRR